MVLVFTVHPFLLTKRDRAALVDVTSCSSVGPEKSVSGRTLRRLHVNIALCVKRTGMHRPWDGKIGFIKRMVAFAKKKSSETHGWVNCSI